MRLTSCSYLTALRPSAVATSAKCEVSWRDWCCPSPGQPVHRACASRPCSTATIRGEWWPLELGTQSSHQCSSLTGAGSPETPRTGFGEPRPLCPEPGLPLETEAGILHPRHLQAGLLPKTALCFLIWRWRMQPTFYPQPPGLSMFQPPDAFGLSPPTGPPCLANSHLPTTGPFLPQLLN